MGGILADMTKLGSVYCHSARREILTSLKLVLDLQSNENNAYITIIHRLCRKSQDFVGV